jgi:hypothetical protein
MSTPPFPPDQVADARRLVANLPDHLPAIPQTEIGQHLATAWAILRLDRDWRRRAATPLTATQPGDAA